MKNVNPALAFCLALGLSTVCPVISDAAFNYFDPLDNSKAPALLSATGFYDNIATKQITARAFFYDVNTQLWSDAAQKRRWVILKPNAHIRYQAATDYYTYPDSAVFAKEFAIDTVPGNPATRILWETRFMILKKDTAAKVDQWYGFTYRWNAQGTDARLVNLAEGEYATVKTYPKGLGQPAVMKKWHFPSQNDCNNCHRLTGATSQARGVLGFFTAQLNRTVPGTNNQPIDQLGHLFDAGVFETVTPRPSFVTAPRWAALTDTTASLDLRARSYLGANCSGCHSLRGEENNASHVLVNFDFYDMKKPEEFTDNSRNGALEYQQTGAGNPDTKDSNSIVRPRHPEFSAIIWRLKAETNEPAPADTSTWIFSTAFLVNPASMPPVGRYETDTVATKLLTQWINTLPERAASIRNSHRELASMPRILGGHIQFSDVNGLPSKVWLVDTRGIRRQLLAAGAGSYSIPVGTAPGVYNLVLDGKRSYRILLP
ncbi:MAG: hypothetical protein ABI036_17505 [Fibrobacteria bacterium]